MSDYTQTTFFAPKDALISGDPEKVILGTDLDPELSAISTAIATKIDEPASPSAGAVLAYIGSVWTYTLQFTANADGSSAITSDTGSNSWAFQNNGDFVAPGDIIIDTQGANAGSLELRNYELSGQEGWYSLVTTNDGDGLVQATLVMSPANENQVTSAGAYFSGEVFVETNNTDSSSSGFKRFSFRKNGELRLEDQPAYASVSSDAVLTKAQILALIP